MLRRIWPFCSYFSQIEIRKNENTKSANANVKYTKHKITQRKVIYRRTYFNEQIVTTQLAAWAWTKRDTSSKKTRFSLKSGRPRCQVQTGLPSQAKPAKRQAVTTSLLKRCMAIRNSQIYKSAGHDNGVLTVSIKFLACLHCRQKQLNAKLFIVNCNAICPPLPPSSCMHAQMQFITIKLCKICNRLDCSVNKL